MKIHFFFDMNRSILLINIRLLFFFSRTNRELTSLIFDLEFLSVLTEDTVDVEVLVVKSYMLVFLEEFSEKVIGVDIQKYRTLINFDRVIVLVVVNMGKVLEVNTQDTHRSIV